MTETLPTIGHIATLAAAEVDKIRLEKSGHPLAALIIHASFTGRMIVPEGRQDVVLTSTLAGNVSFPAAMELVNYFQLLKDTMVPELTALGRLLAPVFARIAQLPNSRVSPIERPTLGQFMQAMIEVNTQAATRQRDYLVYDASGQVKR